VFEAKEDECPTWFTEVTASSLRANDKTGRGPYNPCKSFHVRLIILGNDVPAKTIIIFKLSQYRANDGKS
jgi:hypothetical protein